MISELQELLEANLHTSSDASLVRGIGEGIALADNVMESEPLLRTPIGMDIKGHIRRAGAMWRLQDLCIRGELPYEADIVKMPIGSWHYLELRPSPSLVAHLCKTESAMAFPTDTPNRQDERLTNQFELFEAENVVQFSDVKEKSVWLTYGCLPDGEVSHVCWAMPSPACDSQVWHAHIDVIRRMGTKKSAPVNAPIERKPKINPRDALRFKKEIQEALSNPENKKEDK